MATYIHFLHESFHFWTWNDGTIFTMFFGQLGCAPRKGQDYTKDFMDWKCKLIFPKTQDPNAAGNHFAEIASFISKWTSKEGVSRVLLVLLIVC